MSFLLSKMLQNRKKTTTSDPLYLLLCRSQIIRLNNEINTVLSFIVNTVILLLNFGKIWGLTYWKKFQKWPFFNFKMGIRIIHGKIRLSISMSVTSGLMNPRVYLMPLALSRYSATIKLKWNRIGVNCKTNCWETTTDVSILMGLEHKV